MKIGDRVRVLNQPDILESYVGREATVVEITGSGYPFQIFMDGDCSPTSFKESELELLRNERTKLVYLAAPYTDKDPEIVEFRIQTLCQCDVQLMRNGVFTCSPLLKFFILNHSDL